MRYRRYKRVKKPNIVNGLTEVKVNPYNNEREYEYASRQGSREGSREGSEERKEKEVEREEVVLRISEGSYSPVVSQVALEEERNRNRSDEVSVESVGENEEIKRDENRSGRSSKEGVKIERGAPSVESYASASLGEIRRDKNGTQGMAT